MLPQQPSEKEYQYMYGATGEIPAGNEEQPEETYTAQKLHFHLKEIYEMYDKLERRVGIVEHQLFEQKKAYWHNQEADNSGLEKRIAELEAFNLGLADGLKKSPVVGVDDSGYICKCCHCGAMFQHKNKREVCCPKCNVKPSPAVDTIQISRKVMQEYVNNLESVQPLMKEIYDELRKALEGKQ
jgi:hypothetical protein